MAAQPVPVVVHSWAWETRSIPQPTPMNRTRRIDQWRLVCTCGFHTRWRQAAYLAQREGDRHGLDGQQSTVW